MNNKEVNKPNNSNKSSHELKKLILQLHAKIDLIKGCVIRLEQKVKNN